MRESSLRVPVIRLTLAVSLLAASLVSTAPTMGHALQAPIAITVGGGWASADQAPAFAQMVEGFNKVQSAIHVTAIKNVGDSQVLTELPAGKAPDVFVNFNAADVAPWANAGYILNLDPLIQQAHFDT